MQAQCKHIFKFKHKASNLPSTNKQNASKMVSVVSFTGPGSRTELRDIAKYTVPYKIATSAKSLGSIINATCSATEEISERLTAVRMARYRSKSMWNQRGISWKLRRITLIAQIQNSALSGLESYVLTDRQCGLLDSAIAAAGRSALRGKAIQRGEDGAVTGNLTNAQVLHYWDIPTTKTELRVRRLKWLQKMALHPLDSVLPLAALFSTCLGEQGEPEMACTLPDGGIGPGASPWTIQAYNDIDHLLITDEGSDLLVGLNKKYLRIFQDQLLANEFAALDLDFLRKRGNLVAVPPANTVISLIDEIHNIPHAAENFKCQLCSCYFTSKKVSSFTFAKYITFVYYPG